MTPAQQGFEAVRRDEELKTKKTFEATGKVYGKYWGGGEGAFEARKIRANTKQELFNQITKGVKDGSLDSGMGYEQVLGAFMDIVEITEIEIDGKVYVNKEYGQDFFGELTSDQEDWMMENCW